MNRILLVVSVFLFTSTLAAEEPALQPLGTLNLNLDALQQWKTKSYSYQVEPPGKRRQAGSGTFTLKTIVEDDHVILDDEASVTYRGEKFTLKIKHVCEKNNFLSPTRIESVGEGSDELGTFVMTVSGTEATVQRNGEEQQFVLPEDTVTPWALMRIVTLLPRQKGSIVTFEHWMESSELNQKESFRVESLGNETIEIGDTETVCTKFRCDGSGFPAYYWVDDAGVLQQVLIDERKLMQLQSDEEK